MPATSKTRRPRRLMLLSDVDGWQSPAGERCASIRFRARHSPVVSASSVFRFLKPVMRSLRHWRNRVAYELIPIVGGDPQSILREVWPRLVDGVRVKQQHIPCREITAVPVDSIAAGKDFVAQAMAGVFLSLE